MPERTRELLLRVETTHASDSAELDKLARNLRAELLDAPVADVQQVSAGLPPAGAKALDAFSWATLRLLLDPAVFKALFSTLVSWLRRNEGTSLRLLAGDCEVELKGTELDPVALQKMLETCLEVQTGAGIAHLSEEAAAGSALKDTAESSTPGGTILKSEAPEVPPNAAE